jgi:cytochrome c-type biogenesis protein CcmH/NrfG
MHRVFLTASHPIFGSRLPPWNMPRKAVTKASGDRGEYLDLLAQAYFEAGNAKDAVSTEEQALSSTPDAQGQRGLKKHLAQFMAAERPSR